MPGTGTSEVILCNSASEQSSFLTSQKLFFSCIIIHTTTAAVEIDINILVCSRVINILRNVQHFKNRVALETFCLGFRYHCIAYNPSKATNKQYAFIKTTLNKRI